MRIPEWTPAQHPIPDELLQSILNRRGGALINLDKALLWSEPVARGWNQYVGAVRSKLPTSWKLRELGICTVALLTGATYEYHHHAPDFLKAGGTQAELDALNLIAETNACLPQKHAALGELEGLVISVLIRSFEPAIRAASRERRLVVICCISPLSSGCKSFR